jgi:ribose-phosphate pyrophosphokinase
MTLTLLSGTAHPALADAVADQLGTVLGRCNIVRFPDGELHVEVLDSVRGSDVYILQPTSPLADPHLMELLLLGDACQRAGAARITAVIPYFAYARQDRRARGREAVGARIVADVLQASSVQRVVAVDVHTPTIEGFFGVPFEHLSALPSLIEALGPRRADQATIVAPDLGASKLAERYGTELNLPVAVVHKTRLSGEDVRVSHVTGDVRDSSPIIVDDMISTGGTIEAAYLALREADCREELIVVATHGLLVGKAIERLQALPLKRLIVTDSVPLPEGTTLPLAVVNLRGLLSDAILRLHEERSLADLIEHR